MTPWNPMTASSTIDEPSEPGWMKEPDVRPADLPPYFVSLLDAIAHRNSEFLNCLARSQDPDVSRAATLAARCDLRPRPTWRP